ncbi:MAG: sensor histidine kinase [Deinococcaceae bacterium]
MNTEVPDIQHFFKTHLVGRYFSHWTSRYTYTGMLYVLLSFPVGLLWFCFLVTGLMLSLATCVIWIGFPIAAGILWGNVQFARLEAVLSSLLGDQIHVRSQVVRATGLMSWLGQNLLETRTYTFALYGLLKLPLGLFSFSIFACFITICITLWAIPFLYFVSDIPFWIGSVEIQLTPLSWLGWFLISIAWTTLTGSVIHGLSTAWLWIDRLLIAHGGLDEVTHREVRVLKETSQIIAFSGSLEDTLIQVAARANEALGTREVVFSIPDVYSQYTFFPGFSVTFSEAFSSHHFAHISCPEERGRVILSRVSMEGLVATMGLYYGAACLGQLHALYGRSKNPTDRDLELLATFADQTAVAVETANLIERVRLQTTQQERDRLARELHDSVSQALFGIFLGVKTAKHHSQDPKTLESLDYVLQLTEGAHAEMKSLLFGLREETFDDLSLSEALSQQVHTLRIRHGLRASLEIAEEPELASDMRYSLYKIAQEAIHNIVKHAAATEVHIQLTRDASVWTLLIEDNGKGFDLDQIAPGTLGLQSMSQRVQHMGTQFHVRSTPNAGTQIEVTWIEGSV